MTKSHPIPRLTSEITIPFDLSASVVHKVHIDMTVGQIADILSPETVVPASQNLMAKVPAWAQPARKLLSPEKEQGSIPSIGRAVCLTKIIAIRNSRASLWETIPALEIAPFAN